MPPAFFMFPRRRGGCEGGWTAGGAGGCGRLENGKRGGRLGGCEWAGRIQICQNRGKWIRFLLACSSRAVSCEFPCHYIKKRPYSYGLFISVFYCAVGSLPLELTLSRETFAFRMPPLKRRPFRTYQSRGPVARSVPCRSSLRSLGKPSRLECLRSDLELRSRHSRGYSKISVTTPEPTVLPPSLIANLSPSSIAIGVIRSISIVMLSPGMHISTPSGSFRSPVTSVVLK